MLFRSTPANSKPQTTPISPPLPSPPPSPRKMPLTIHGVANIFIKMRRIKEQVKAHHVESTSGDSPQSHPGLAEAASPKKEPLELTEVFVCIGGVNLTTLLRATRGALMETAEALGANALVEEQWKCTICAPKQRANGTYRVQIQYAASATRSDRVDPHKPVALNQAKGVPGLMTILKRNDV